MKNENTMENLSNVHKYSLPGRKELKVVSTFKSKSNKTFEKFKILYNSQSILVYDRYLSTFNIGGLAPHIFPRVRSWYNSALALVALGRIYRYGL